MSNDLTENQATKSVDSIDWLSMHRKLDHAKRRLQSTKNRHEEKGGSMNLTYHGGYDLGYWEGRISVLEDILIDNKPDEQSATH